MTLDQAAQIIRNASRCTQAALMSYGIEGIPHQASGCLEYFHRAGFLLVPGPRDLTFNTWSKIVDLKKTNWFVITNGYAMSIVNGVLIDTQMKSFDKRHVQWSWEVMGKGEK